jgi:surface antigen
MMKKTVLAIFVSSVMTLSGCASLKEYGITQEQIGTGVGVVVGIGVGSLIGQGNGRLAAMAVGALIGGYVGNNIGQSLDERDRASLAATTEHFLNAQSTSPFAQSTTWKSADTGATAAINASAPVQKVAKVAVKSAPKVHRPKIFTAAHGQYVALSSASVRSGPGTSYQKIDGVAKGSKIDVIGVIGDWTMVAKGGVLSGYVKSDLLKSSDGSRVVDVSAKTSLPVANVTEPQKAVVSSKPVAPVIEATSKIADAGPVVLDFDQAGDSQAVVSCKNVRLDIKDTKGAPANQSFETCHASGGDWVVM